MISIRAWRWLAAPVFVLAALESSAWADDNSASSIAQLPNRNPTDLKAREVPAVQGPGAFTTADNANCSTDGSTSVWDNCRGRWTVCKDNLHRRFAGCADQDVVPLGTFVNAVFQAQIVNGEAACMCLHHYDFMDGTSQLNPHGQEQVGKILALLPRNFAPVVIEGTGVPKIDEARRMHVYQELSTPTFPIPYERVVCSPTKSDTLGGSEAELINANLMTHTQAKGNVNTAAGLTFGTGNGGGGH